jgi:hypothetical protein
MAPGPVYINGHSPVCAGGICSLADVCRLSGHDGHVQRSPLVGSGTLILSAGQVCLVLLANSTSFTVHLWAAAGDVPAAGRDQLLKY